MGGCSSAGLADGLDGFKDVSRRRPQRQMLPLIALLHPRASVWPAGLLHERRWRTEEDLRRSEGPILAEAQKITHTGSWAYDVRDSTGGPIRRRNTIACLDSIPQRACPGAGDWVAAHPSG